MKSASGGIVDLPIGNTEVPPVLYRTSRRICPAVRLLKGLAPRRSQVHSAKEQIAGWLEKLGFAR